MKSWQIFLIVAFLILTPTLFYYLYPSISYLSLSDPKHTLTLSPETELSQYWYHSTEYNFGGHYSLTGPGRVIQASVFYVLGLVFPPKFSAFFFVFSLLVIGGWGFYAFLRSFIFNQKQNQDFLSIIGALFYATNLFVCISLFSINLLLPYLLTPWIIYCLLRYLQHQKFKYLLFSSLLLTLLGVTPRPTALIMILVVGWIIITASVVEKYPLRRVFVSFAKVSVATLLLSVWWLLPILIYALNYSSDLSLTLATERFYSLRSSFLNVFHLSSQWALFNTYSGQKFFYFSDVLQNLRWLFVLLAALLLIPLLSRSLVAERKDRIWLLSLFVLLVLGYLLAEGYHESSPISGWYLWLVNHTIFFGTFRNSYKFVAIIAFVYSILLPYLYLALKHLVIEVRERSARGKILIRAQSSRFLWLGIVVIILASFSYPLWTGTAYRHYYKGIPQETYEVSDFINEQVEQEPGKMMILPGTWLPHYDWAFYVLSRPIFLSLMDDWDVIIYRYGGSPPSNWRGKELVDNFLYKEFFSLDGQDLLNLGIKYILLDKTLDTKLGGGLPVRNVDVLEHYLDENLVGIYQNDKYTLYEIEGTPNEVFFVPLETRFLDTSDENLMSLLKHLDTEKVVVVNTQIPNHEVPELEVYQPMLSLDMLDDSDGDFSYGCRKWIGESDDVDVTVYEDDILVNCSPHRNRTCYIGKRFHNPLDLTKYDKVDLVVTPSYPVENVRILVLLMDSDQQWVPLGAVPGTPPLELSDETYIEIAIDWNKIYDTGVNPRNIEWIQIGIFNWEEEGNDISLRINKTVTFSSDQPIPRMPVTNGSAPATVTGYTKIDPTLYKVDVVATRPFMLAFNRAHDPMWVAKVNGKEYQSLPLYSVITGFWIEETGELEITLEYKPQRWFYYGVAISLASLVAALAFLVWGWRKGILKRRTGR